MSTGFARALEYVLVHAGFSYDSKAIVGVAHLLATGALLPANAFTGGKGGAAKRLEELGFSVSRQKRTSASDSRARSPKRLPDPVEIAVCPVHFTELPANGVCDLCE